ncbi:MAG: PQQ-binding-like beta-propeller repeat protein [Bryobacteraceae bacterium]|nr:PQQ-binding-like beta-propeller repeat protein [Bryobacteraceae bacterium]
MRAAFCLAVSLMAADDPASVALYQKHCATCHDAPAAESRIPAKTALQKMPAANILRALEAGVMKEQGAALSRVEKLSVAKLLGSSESVMNAPSANPCPAADWKPHAAAADWRGWSANDANWRYQPKSGIAPPAVANLKLKWAFGFPGGTSVRSQPVVFGGRLFVGAHDGSIYALDATTGCQHWSTTVPSPIRSSLAAAEVQGRWMIFAGDSAGLLHALDATTGAPLWKLRLDAHPAAVLTATPVVHQGRVYVGVASYEEASATNPAYVCCSFRGSVAAVDGASGKLLWKTYTISEEAKPGPVSKRGKPTQGPSGVGIWSAVTLDPGLGMLYATTGDNYSDPPTPNSDAVMALSLDTGKVQWVKQILANDAFNSSCANPTKFNCPDSDGPDHDLGASAMLVKLPNKKRALILAQKSGEVHAVDPDRKGEVLWHARVGKGGVLGGIQWGIATDGITAYAAVSDLGFGPQRSKQGGGLFALRLDNGERLWQTPAPSCAPEPCSPSQSAAITVMPGIVFSGSVDGHLRAYSTIQGKILWDFDTAQTFDTVNGVKAHGGSMDAGGPVLANGMLYVGSGYGQWGGKPGNVLLAFEPTKP